MQGETHVVELVVLFLDLALRAWCKACFSRRASVRVTFQLHACRRVVFGQAVVNIFGSVYMVADSFFDISRRNVRRQQAADHQALDVAHGVPPPRAAPPLLRRVVLSESVSVGTRIIGTFQGNRGMQIWGVLVCYKI